MPAVLEGARLVAHAFGSYMEGFAVRPSPATYVTVEPVSSLAISGAYEGDSARAARSLFETFMQPAQCAAGGEGAGGLFLWLAARRPRGGQLHRQPRPRLRPDRARPARTRSAKSAHAAFGDRLVRQRPPGADRAVDGAEEHRPQHPRRLEPQHPAGAHQCLRAAAAAPRRQSDGADGRRRHRARARPARRRRNICAATESRRRR